MRAIGNRSLYNLLLRNQLFMHARAPRAASIIAFVLNSERLSLRQTPPYVVTILLSAAQKYHNESQTLDCSSRSTLSRMYPCAPSQEDSARSLLAFSPLLSIRLGIFIRFSGGGARMKRSSSHEMDGSLWGEAGDKGAMELDFSDSGLSSWSSTRFDEGVRLSLFRRQSHTRMSEPGAWPDSARTRDSRGGTSSSHYRRIFDAPS